MPNPITLQDLTKAAENLTRIDEFLAVRRRWHLELAGYEALRDFDSAAELIIRTIDPFLDAHGLTIDWADEPSLEQLPTTKFDSDRLARMSDFMVQLGRWFQDHAEGTLEPAAGPALGQVYGSVGRIRKTAVEILDSSPYRQSVPDRRPPSGLAENAPPEPRPMADAGPDSAIALGSRKVAPGPRQADQTATAGAPASSGARLVLEDTDETPLLQTFRGETELTPEARERIDTFLTDHDVDLSGYRGHKLEMELERRIRNTPDGQVLVVKIGTIDGTPKPYFSYQRKRQEPAE